MKERKLSGLVAIGALPLVLWSEVLGNAGNGWLGGQAVTRPTFIAKLYESIGRPLNVLRLFGNDGGEADIKGARALIRLCEQVEYYSRGEKSFYIAANPESWVPDSPSFDRDKDLLVAVTEKTISEKNGWAVTKDNIVSQDDDIAKIKRDVQNDGKCKKVLSDDRNIQTIVKFLAQHSGRNVCYLEVNPGNFLGAIGRFKDYFSRFYWAEPNGNTDGIQNKVEQTEEKDRSGHFNLSDQPVRDAIKVKMKKHALPSGNSCKIEVHKKTENVLFIVADVVKNEVYLVFEGDYVPQQGGSSWSIPWKTIAMVSVPVVLAFTTRLHSQDSNNGPAIPKGSLLTIGKYLNQPAVNKSGMTLPNSNKFSLKYSNGKPLPGWLTHFSFVDTGLIKAGLNYAKKQSDSTGQITVPTDTIRKWQKTCNSSEPIWGSKFLGRVRPYGCIPLESVLEINSPGPIQTPTQPENTAETGFGGICTLEAANKGMCTPKQIRGLNQFEGKDIFFKNHSGENVRYVAVISEETAKFLMEQDPAWKSVLSERQPDGTYLISCSEEKARELVDFCKVSPDQCVILDRWTTDNRPKPLPTNTPVPPPPTNTTETNSEDACTLEAANKEMCMPKQIRGLNQYEGKDIFFKNHPEANKRYEGVIPETTVKYLLEQDPSWKNVITGRQSDGTYRISCSEEKARELVDFCKVSPDQCVILDRWTTDNRPKPLPTNTPVPPPPTNTPVPPPPPPTNTPVPQPPENTTETNSKDACTLEAANKEMCIPTKNMGVGQYEDKEIYYQNHPKEDKRFVAIISKETAKFLMEQDPAWESVLSEEQSDGTYFISCNGKKYKELVDFCKVSPDQCVILDRWTTDERPKPLPTNTPVPPPTNTPFPTCKNGDCDKTSLFIKGKMTNLYETAGRKVKNLFKK